MLSINDITGYPKAIVRVIVPDIVPASDQKRLRNAAKSVPPSDSTKATVFLNQAFRQTAALQAVARLSWWPDPVNHPGRRDAEGGSDGGRRPRRRIAVS
jgi:hypothetical protein